MGKLTEKQKEYIWLFLKDRKLKFVPLRAELYDHLCSDIEQKVSRGLPFNEAFAQITQLLPEGHLKTLEIETMNAATSKQRSTHLLGYFSLALLVLATIFKLLKLSGAGNLLISAMVILGFTLISSSVVGIEQGKQKKWLSIGLALSICTFLTSFIFTVLHLPGGNEIRILSVFMLSILFGYSFFSIPANYVSDATAWLHQQYGHIIDRLLIVIFGAALLIKTPSILFGHIDLVANILLILTIAGAGFHLFGLIWPRLAVWQSKPLTYMVLVSFCCFIVPAITTIIDPTLRWMILFASFPLMGIIVSIKEDKVIDWSAMVSVLATCTILFSSFCVHLLLLPETILAYIFNPVVLVGLGLLVAIKWKNRLFRVYMIIVLCHYLLIYQGQLP